MTRGQDIAETSILHGMRERMPWRVAMNVMRRAGLTPSQGWDRTIEKLRGSDEVVDEEILQRLLLEHILVGEKFVIIHRANDGVLQEMRDQITEDKFPESIGRDRFPNVLSEAELNDADVGVTPIKVLTETDGIAIVFSSIRIFASKEQIDADDLPEDSEFLFSEFDEIIGYRNRRVQAFDVIWVPNEGNEIEVRIDYPTGMSKDIASVVYNQLLKKLEELAEPDLLHEPVNLYPLIKRMYDDADEGSVVELAFSTTTGSVKQERMRRHRTCLRREAYHVGGKRALKHEIEPFRLGVVWSRGIEEGNMSRPELLLNGTSRMGADTNPELYAVSIRNSTDADDFDYVIGRLYHHLHAEN